MNNLILSAPIFGSKHIIGLLVVLALVILTLFFIEKRELPFKIVILVITAGILGLEAIKLIYITTRDGSFPMNHLPFHLCSLPLYLYPIISFARRPKVIQFVLPAAYATVLFGGLIALLYPTNILGGEVTWALTKDNFLPYLSFLYHGLMILGPVYILRSGFYRINLLKIKEAFIVTFIFMVMAMIVNFIFEKDFMLLREGNGSPFQFIRDINPILYTVVMIFVGFLAVFIFHGVTCLIVKKDD